MKDISFYTGLITSEYQNSQNFMTFLSTLAQMIKNIDDCNMTIDAAFDLDEVNGEALSGEILLDQGGDLVLDQGGNLMTDSQDWSGLSVNAQLDILGELIGVSRTVNFQPTGGVSPVLDNRTYLLLLKATIGMNTWDGTIDSLAPLWQTLFPGGTIKVIDNQDMTMSVWVSGGFSSIIKDLIFNGYIVPRPEGVLINYILAEAPYFGWDEQDSYIAGWDSGHFV